MPRPMFPPGRVTTEREDMPAALQLTNKEMTDAEWRTRCDLAALYHVVHYLGWTDLINMDMGGNVLGADGQFNNAGFTIHSGVYKARPNANCVMHTHTRAGAGVSLLQQGLRPISQDALHVLDDIAYHPYGVPT